jgi:hypothetical protein
VVNAQHLKAVPGRKTDVRDAEWIADLLQHGLIRPSFIPSRPDRELRELTRYRTSLVRERAAEVNRLQKVLEGANTSASPVVPCSAHQARVCHQHSLSSPLLRSARSLTCLGSGVYYFAPAGGGGSPPMAKEGDPAVPRTLWKDRFV